MTATYDDVFLAILAMDSYNRGYDPGMEGVTGTKIGSATISSDSSLMPGAEDASFYAVAYTLEDDSKVISYRGTTFNTIPDPVDVLQGWTLGAGYAGAGQVGLAKAFYEQIAEVSVYDPNQPTDVVVTGHSLGGGLAASAAT